VSLQPGLQGDAVAPGVDVIYLHGFASSPDSSKAAFLRERLREAGVETHTPDFNLPDFSTLTISRMLAQVAAEIAAVPESRAVALVGSSLGGFVAVQAALKHRGRVARLILMAPALDLGDSQMRTLGDRGIEEWRRTDRLDVFHHTYGRIMPLHFALYTDSRHYDALNARLDLPIQVFQGQRDALVDPATVRAWSRARPNVELHELDDDHQLRASLDAMWPEIARFLGLT
jgi:uncharacterized protein